MKHVKKIQPRKSGIRKYRVMFQLNSDEQNTLDFYLRKYGITNKSRFYREVLMTHILHHLDEDCPTLFDPREMKG